MAQRLIALAIVHDEGNHVGTMLAVTEETFARYVAEGLLPTEDDETRARLLLEAEFRVDFQTPGDMDETIMAMLDVRSRLALDHTVWQMQRRHQGLTN